MEKGRLEAFSDGVFAVAITIMVLELKVPGSTDARSLAGELPVFCAYVLSFVYVGIYWTNHHHLLQAAQRVTGAVLWANLHLLFWLSLVPFATGWLGHNVRATAPVLLYGVVLLLAAVAYWILVRALLACHAEDSVLARAIGRDRKGVLSVVVYVVSLAVAGRAPLVACAGYVLVACLWLVPDRRIERTLPAEDGTRAA